MSAQTSPPLRPADDAYEPSAFRRSYPILAPPLVWAFELYANFAISSHACFPSEAPRADFLPGWTHVWHTALTVNIVCAIASAVGLLLAASRWRTLRQDGASGLLWERLNAEALSGMLISALFTVAILFNTVSLGSLSTCSRA